MRLEIKNSTAYLVLNQAQRGNGIGMSEAEVLKKLLKIKSLTGLICFSESDQFFCTGGNLKEQASSKNKKSSLKTQKLIRQSFDELSKKHYPKSVIVNGNCFGGGVEFISCFDYIVATPHSYFGLWQRKLGLSFGWGGGERLLKRLSQKNFDQLFYTARSISVYEAHKIGLVDEIASSYFALNKARSFINNVQMWPDNLEKIKAWSPKTSSQIFEKLWMNKDHLSVLKKYSK